MNQYCFACCRLSASFVVVCNARGRSVAAGPGAWPVRRPTLHGGTVRLRSVRATPCLDGLVVLELERRMGQTDDGMQPVMGPLRRRASTCVIGSTVFRSICIALHNDIRGNRSGNAILNG